MSGALSGADVSNSAVDIEETAEESIVRGLRKWWENKGTQDKVARLYTRKVAPHAFVCWLSSRKALVVMTLDDFQEMAQR